MVVDAEYNWWGDATGPYDGSNDTGTGGWFNPGGLGDDVSDYVDYDPWAVAEWNVVLDPIIYIDSALVFRIYWILSRFTR